MQISDTAITGVKIIQPKRFGDSRGFFSETFRQDGYTAVNSNPFIQENWSRSTRGVLRGLHLQCPNEQGKLVSVIRGAVLDVAVDVRIGSPTFGQHVAVTLSDENGLQFFVPRGFAHGFLVLSETVDFVYKCDSYYSATDEIIVRWNDPAIGIAWPILNPILSARDASAPLLANIGKLPQYAV